MGRILKFRRSRRADWTRAGAYRNKRLKGLGEFDRPKSLTRVRWPEDRVTLRGVARETAEWMGKLRPFILGAILLTIWPAMDPALMEPPKFLQTEPERVSEHFTRCGPGRGHACVIDGDTIRLGDRKIRIIGIDTAEVVARCPAEATQAATCAHCVVFGPTGRYSRSPTICAVAALHDAIWVASGAGGADL